MSSSIIPSRTIKIGISHRNRAGLLLDGGQVYVAFAGRCEVAQWAKDRGPLPFGRSFQGWIYAFDAAKLALTGKYRTTRTPDDATLPPDGEDPAGGGGVWQASAGPASDGRGSLYFSTGNQAQGFAGFKTAADPLGRNLPDSVVRLRVDRRPMTPTDWFTPYRKVWLDLEDLDLAAAGVVLIPNSRYLVAAGEGGYSVRARPRQSREVRRKCPLRRDNPHPTG